MNFKPGDCVYLNDVAVDVIRSYYTNKVDINKTYEILNVEYGGSTTVLMINLKADKYNNRAYIRVSAKFCKKVVLGYKISRKLLL